MANFSLTPPVSGRVITAHLFCAIALSTTHAQAQTPADAGQILQQIEKERGSHSGSYHIEQGEALTSKLNWRRVKPNKIKTGRNA